MADGGLGASDCGVAGSTRLGVLSRGSEGRDVWWWAVVGKAAGAC